MHTLGIFAKSWWGEYRQVYIVNVSKLWCITLRGRRHYGSRNQRGPGLLGQRNLPKDVMLQLRSKAEVKVSWVGGGGRRLLF